MCMAAAAWLSIAGIWLWYGQNGETVVRNGAGGGSICGRRRARKGVDYMLINTLNGGDGGCTGAATPVSRAKNGGDNNEHGITGMP